MTRREQRRISRRLRSPTYPKRCVHHALFSDRCILCLKARIRDLSQQIDVLKARLDRIATGDFDGDVADFAAQAFSEKGRGGRESGGLTGTEPDPECPPVVGTAAAIPATEPHDCLTREHDPDEWCPDCFAIKKVDP